MNADLRGKRLLEIIEPIRKALDVPVYPGRAAWGSRGTLGESASGKYLWDVARSLRALGIETVVEPDAVFFLTAEDR